MASLLVLPLVLVATTAATVVVLSPDLPGPVATHFGLSGAADGFMSVPALLFFTVGIQVALGGLLGALATSASRAVPAARAIMGLPAGLVAFIGALVVVTLLPQRGLEQASSATIGGGALPLALGIALAAGRRGSSRAPPPPPPGSATGHAPASAPRTDLGGGAGVWRGSTRTGRAVPALISVVVLLAVVLSWAAGPVIVLPFMLLPLGALLASLRFSVAIGPAGVGLRGVLGWPRTLVAIDTITHADVEQVTPMAYGGWGWRVRLDGRTAIVTSAGPGLVIHRADAPAIVVTIDDADRAAGVVNQLVDRREDSRAADPA